MALRWAFAGLILAASGAACAQSYERLVDDAHERYESALEGKQQTENPHPVRARAGRRLPAKKERPGDGASRPFRLHPTTPYPDTPEWRREQEWLARREQEIGRKLQSICRGC